MVEINVNDPYTGESEEIRRESSRFGLGRRSGALERSKTTTREDLRIYCGEGQLVFTPDNIAFQTVGVGWAEPCTER